MDDDDLETYWMSIRPGPAISMPETWEPMDLPTAMGLVPSFAQQAWLAMNLDRGEKDLPGNLGSQTLSYRNSSKDWSLTVDTSALFYTPIAIGKDPMACYSIFFTAFLSGAQNELNTLAKQNEEAKKSIEWRADVIVNMKTLLHTAPHKIESVPPVPDAGDRVQPESIAERNFGRFF